MTTLSVTHNALQVGMGSTAGGDQSGVSASGLALSPGVSLVPPGNLDPPTITGDTVAGQPLTASLGTWSDANDLRARWSRCASDVSNCHISLTTGAQELRVEQSAFGGQTTGPLVSRA